MIHTCLGVYVFGPLFVWFGTRCKLAATVNDPLARYLQQRSYRTERRLRLRAMKTNEALDLAARAYQQTGRPMLQAVAVPSLFCLAGFAFFWSYAFPSLWTTRNPGSTQGQIAEAAVAMALAMFVAAPLFLIGASFATSVTTRLVADYMVGNVPHIEGAVRAARGKLGAMFKLLFRQLLFGSLFFLVAMGMLMASAFITVANPNSLEGPALIAGIATFGFIAGLAWVPFVMCRFALAPAAMMMEDLSAGEAMKRSANLLKAEGRTRSGYETVVNGLILVCLLYLLGGWGLYALSSELGIGAFIADKVVGSTWTDLLDSLFGYLPWYLVIWITIPLWSTVCTIVYFERRVRKEGFDIEVLAQDVWRTDQSRRFQL